MADAAQGNASASYAWGPLSAFGLVVAVIACLHRSGVEILAPVRFRSRRAASPCRVHAVSRSRPDLEHRHQLRPVSAAGAARPMGAARLQGCGGGVAVGLAGAGIVPADRRGARPDYRRGVRQRHRPPALAGSAWILCCFTSIPPAWSFRWYVFNLADVAIVAGVVGLCMNPCGAGRRKSALIPYIKQGVAGSVVGPVRLAFRNVPHRLPRVRVCRKIESRAEGRPDACCMRAALPRRLALVVVGVAPIPPPAPATTMTVNRSWTSSADARPQRSDGRRYEINYSERSPLVVPPNRDLPPPVTATAPPAPDWPKDPDVKAQRQGQS